MDESKQVSAQGSALSIPPLNRDDASAAPSLDAVFRVMLAPIRNSLVRIERRIQQSADAPGSRGAAAALDPELVLSSLDGRLVPLVHQLHRLEEQMSGLLEQSKTMVQEPLDVDSLADSLWEEIILGNDLCRMDPIALTRRQLMDDVVSGNRAARVLAGHLLLIQAIENSEFPEHLCDVGEAYYRWHPRISTEEDPFERALADSLTRRAEAAGLPNSIVLVRPGDRYDDSRHTPTNRGREIVGIHGWMVLRENQKVYTKATVTLR